MVLVWPWTKCCKLNSAGIELRLICLNVHKLSSIRTTGGHHRYLERYLPHFSGSNKWLYFLEFLSAAD